MKYKLDKNLQEFLEEFNLTEREIAIYLTLLKTGPNTIMNLARETGIKRSTTHNNVEELIKKGLVSQTNYGERRMVVAEEPDKLKFLLEQKKWRVKKLEENLDSVIGTINKMVPGSKDTSKVEVKYYEDKDQIAIVYNQILTAKEVYSFVNVDKVKAVIPENLELFAKALVSNNQIKMWEIIEDSNHTKEQSNKYDSKRYHYKLIPKGVTLSDTDIMVFDEKIAMINLDTEHQTAIVIESKALSEGIRNIHKMLWALIG